MRGDKPVEGRPLDEQGLIARAQDGDTAAFGDLVRMHQELAVRVAYLVVRNHAEAADVTQDAFIKAYRSIGRFRAGTPLRPWLMRIVRNEALNRVRSAKRRERVALKVAGESASGEAAPSPEADALASDAAARMAELVDRLPARQQAVVTHRFLLGLSEEETATALRIPRGTVKSRTARALDKLRALTEPEAWQ